MYNEKALEFDSKLIENWREDANGLMILVSHRPTLYLKLVWSYWMTEWFGLSRCRWIPVTDLYFISNKLSRRLGLLPLSDLSTTAWFE